MELYYYLVLVLWAIGSAAGIELLQFLIGLFIGVQYRSVDIDDVILNMIGFGIGYILHFAILPLYHSFIECKKCLTLGQKLQKTHKNRPKTHKIRTVANKVL